MKRTVKKIQLQSKRIRDLTLHELGTVNGASQCGPGIISSCVTIHCGGGNTGMLCQTHEYPCTVAPF